MYENLWQPYATPYQARYNAPQQAFGSKLEVIRVNGKNGAEAFQMSPNSSIILLDESAPLIWLKMTDGAGYPTLTPYRIEPLKSEPPVDSGAVKTALLKYILILIKKVLIFENINAIISRKTGERKSRTPERTKEMEHFNEKDIKIIMATGKSEKKAKRELERGTYVMELQDFIDACWELYEAERVSTGLDEETYAEEYPEDLECTERTIAAVTEMAEHIKNFSDKYFDVADEFNTVVNFNGKQYVIHWAL